MSDYEDYQHLSLEDKFSALVEEMVRRVPTIRGHAILVNRWLESQANESIPQDVRLEITEIIKAGDSLWKVLKQMTKDVDL